MYLMATRNPIDVDQIREVLLADGWHRCLPLSADDARSSFQLLAFEFCRGTDAVGDFSNQTFLNDERFTGGPNGCGWLEAVTEEVLPVHRPPVLRVTCPLSHVLAVRSTPA